MVRNTGSFPLYIRRDAHDYLTSDPQQASTNRVLLASPRQAPTASTLDMPILYTNHAAHIVAHPPARTSLEVGSAREARRGPARGHPLEAQQTRRDKWTASVCVGGSGGFVIRSGVHNVMIGVSGLDNQARLLRGVHLVGRLQ